MSEKVHIITVTVEMEDNGFDALANAGGLLHWIDDCEGVIDSTIIAAETTEQDGCP